MWIRHCSSTAEQNVIIMLNLGGATITSDTDQGPKSWEINQIIHYQPALPTQPGVNK